MKPTHTRYWVVAFALALAMIMYIQRVAISAAIVPIAADLHLDQKEKGWVLGAFGLSYALFEIPMGLMGDKLGVRWVLTQVVLLWSLFTALTGAAWNLAIALGDPLPVRRGRGGLLSQSDPHAVGLAAAVRARQGAGRDVGLRPLGRGAGAAGGDFRHRPCSAGGGALSRWPCWAWPGSRCSCPGSATIRPSTKSVNKEELALLEGGRELVLHDHGVPWYRLLLQRDIAFLGLQYFGFSYTWYFYVTWLPTWLHEARGLSMTQVGLYATLAAGGRAVAAPSCRASCRYRSRANGWRCWASSPPRR